MEKLGYKIRTWVGSCTSTTRHKLSLILTALLLLSAQSVFANSDGSLKWKVAIGTSYNNPAIDKFGNIYIGSSDHHLYSISPTGTIRWKYKTRDSIESASPVIHNDTVYIGSTDNTLYAVDLNGSLKWQFQANARIFSSVSVTPTNDIILSTYTDGVYCLSSSGIQRWHYQPDGQVLGSSAVDANGNIFFADDARYVYSLTQAGKIRWKFPAHHAFKFNGIALDDAQNVYVGDGTRYLYSLTNNGLLRWLYDAQKTVDSNPIILASGDIAFGSSNTYLQVTTQDTGSFVWRHQTAPSGYVWRASPTVRADGAILIGGYSRQLIAIRPNSTPIWNFHTGGSIFSSPAVASDGTIYFTSQDGFLYALYGTSPLADTAWPKAGRNNQNNGLATTLETTSIGWEFDTTAEVRSAPEISPSGQIYVGSKEGSLFSLNSDGSEAWRFYTGSTVQAQPKWHDGVIYVGNNSGEFYAIDQQGNYIWSYQTNGSVIGKAIIAAEQVFIGSMDGKIYCFNRHNGFLHWTLETGGPIRTALQFDSTVGRLFAVSDSNKLYSIDPLDPEGLDGGNPWTYEFTSRPVTTPILDAAKTIYVATYDGTFYAFDQSGMLEWSHTAGSKFAYQELAMLNDTLFAVGYDKHLTAVQAWGSTLWREDFSAFITGSVRVSEGIGAEQFIVIGDYAGNVTRLDKDGNIRWQTHLPTKIAAATAIDTTSGDVIVSGLNGKVYAVREN